MSKKNDVGYKKPPKNNQFKKGKSGNSKGRPKKKHNILDNMLLMLGKKVDVSLNGELRSLTQAEVFIWQVYKKACEGHGSSQRIFYDILNKHLLPVEAKALEREEREKEFINKDMNKMTDKEVYAYYLEVIKGVVVD